MRGFRRTFLFVFAIVVVLSMAVVVLPLLPILFSDELLPSQPTVIQQQPAQQAPVAPCEPAESLRCRELRGEIPSEPEIQGIQLSFGASSGPSVVETFGWWALMSLVFVALLVALVVAVFTPLTLQQTAPIAVIFTGIILITQSGWVFLVTFLLLIGIVMWRFIKETVKQVMAAVAVIGRAGGGLHQGMSLFVIWEIIQTLWTHGTIGTIINRAAGGQNPPAQNPNP